MVVLVCNFVIFDGNIFFILNYWEVEILFYEFGYVLYLLFFCIVCVYLWFLIFVESFGCGIEVINVFLCWVKFMII